MPALKFARDGIVIQIVSVFRLSSSSISDAKYTSHDRLVAINWILIRFLQGHRKLKLPPCGEFQSRINLVILAKKTDSNSWDENVRCKYEFRNVTRSFGRSQLWYATQTSVKQHLIWFSFNSNNYWHVCHHETYCFGVRHFVLYNLLYMRLEYPKNSFARCKTVSLSRNFEKLLVNSRIKEKDRVILTYLTNQWGMI